MSIPFHEFGHCLYLLSYGSDPQCMYLVAGRYVLFSKIKQSKFCIKKMLLLGGNIAASAPESVPKPVLHPVLLHRYMSAG